jgi:aminopeptidase-like protein
VIEILENNKKYLNTNPKGEPQLGKRGLYETMGGRKNVNQMELAILWILNLSDGNHNLLEICEKAGYPFEVIVEGTKLLIEQGLLVEV